MPPGGNWVRRLHVTTSMNLLVVLYHQHEEQLSAADLRAFDYERAALTQVRVGLEQDVAFFVELEVQRVTGFIFAASIDVQPKVFAVGEPIFLARLQYFARLAD